MSIRMMGALDVASQQTTHYSVPDPGYAKCPAHGLVAPLGGRCFGDDCEFVALTAEPDALTPAPAVAPPEPGQGRGRRRRTKGG